ncbi:hypothetical protein NIES22_61780 [Calothrix brevissima NIES-22]|nr:hypothetical protein NIES22_61740 [Calothrix brevissima NIES-22]BAY66065.1 hypothetical protein NIES22_61780 [Calothrix brevissima NIES-22]
MNLFYFFKLVPHNTPDESADKFLLTYQDCGL